MYSWASLWIFEFCIAPPTYAKAIFATQPQYISVASYINWKTKKEENGGNIPGKGRIFQFTAQSSIKTCFNKVHNNCQAFLCQIQPKVQFTFLARPRFKMVTPDGWHAG